MLDPKDFDTIEEYLAAVLVEAMNKWADAGKPGVTTQGGDGGGPG